MGDRGAPATVNARMADHMGIMDKALDEGVIVRDIRFASVDLSCV
jgi:hypothetical protein